MADPTLHDPTDTYVDENDVQREEFEAGAEIQEMAAPEERAMEVGNDTAREATANTSETDAEELVEEEAKALDQEMVAEEVATKHKNRESTAEKAKRSTRQSTAEKAKVSEDARKKALDPLRLRGKRYRDAVAKIDRLKVYSIEEAIAAVKETNLARFDAAIELHVKVKNDAVRGVVVLPHGSGKTRNVVLATDDVLEEIAAGKMNFEVLIATPAMMPKLAKFAKVLGPKGLMPSPKAGTVTDNPEAVMAEISGGRIEYRADKGNVVHLSIGRVSFTDLQLLENFRVLEAALAAAKMQSVSLASTMGPGVRVAVSK
jgi:large subunit ribosomal protein L1